MKRIEPIHWVLAGLATIGVVLWLGAIVQIDYSNHHVRDEITNRLPADSVAFRFNLRAVDGSQVSDASYRGDWLLVFFGFTRCGEICARALKTISRVKNSQAAAPSMQRIFISIDWPADTPSAVAAYLARFDPQIVGLTGPRDALFEAVESVELYAESVGQSPSTDGVFLESSPYIYLVSPTGALTDSFEFDTSPEAISEDLQRWMSAK